MRKKVLIPVIVRWSDNYYICYSCKREFSSSYVKFRCPYCGSEDIEALR